MSKRKDFHRPEKPLEKPQEIDNDARVSKKAQLKKKKRKKKSEAHNFWRHPAKLSNILGFIDACYFPL